METRIGPAEELSGHPRTPGRSRRALARAPTASRTFAGFVQQQELELKTLQKPQALRLLLVARRPVSVASLVAS